jgi:hypothetical protein
MANNDKEDKIQQGQNKNKEEKFKPGMGVDVGTSNVLVTRQTEDGTFVNRVHRDMLFQLDISDESEDLLQRGDYLCVKTKDKYYIVGEDALKIANAIGRSEDIVRPMKNGILNPNLSTSSELLFFIIKALCKEPIVNKEPLRFTIPANPVDGKLDNRFHQMVLKNFFEKLGYDAKPINEGMALAIDCNPILKEDNGTEINLSGIAMSWGGGMINVAILYKGLELDSFSITSSGDAIDANTSQVTGIPLANVIKAKEKKLNLDKVDGTDRVQTALSIFYDETIERVVKSAGSKFKDKKSELEGKIEIVVGGGTSLCNGFINRLEEGFKKFPIPFDILRVRHSNTPFHSVSQGACIRAMADYARLQK